MSFLLLISVAIQLVMRVARWLSGGFQAIVLCGNFQVTIWYSSSAQLMSQYSITEHIHGSGLQTFGRIDSLRSSIKWVTTLSGTTGMHKI